MAQKRGSSDKATIQLVQKCLGIVFKDKRQKKKDALGTTPEFTGHNLFERFIEENKECYWNPHLEESINNVKYIGFLHPLTLLIGGRDIYIETIKAAWLRRVLRHPPNLSISKFGELEDIYMNNVSQTQFTPLPEVLCLTISQLERQAQAASLEAILQQLQHRYNGMQQPSEHLVYQTLGSLCTEGNIYHTGHGYHIVKPHVEHLNGCPLKGWNGKPVGAESSGAVGQAAGGNLCLHNILNNNNTLNSVPPPTPGESCSVSCQTEQPTNNISGELDGSPNKLECEESVKGTESAGKRLQRSLSLRSHKKDKSSSSPANFQRASSMRVNEEKAAALIKDVNLKSSNVNREKNKGEKQSVLKKLFGRSKNEKKGAAEPDLNSSNEVESCGVKQVELVTFSAQFPPPEWQWYENQAQLLHQQAALSSMPAGDRAIVSPSSRSDPPMVSPSSMCQMSPHHSLSRTENWAHQMNRMHNGESHHMPHCMSHSLPPHIGLSPVMSTNHKFYSSSSEDSYIHHHHKQTRDHHLTNRPSSARRHSTHITTAPPKPQRKEGKHSDVGSIQEEESNVYWEPEFNNNPLKSYSKGGIHETNLDHPIPVPDEGKPSLPPRTHDRSKRNGSRHKQSAFRDINIEYHGKMPKKNRAEGMSRDSGVNCIGLPDKSCVSKGDDKRPDPSSYHVHPDRNSPSNNRDGFKCSSTPRGKHVITQATVHEASIPHDSGFSSPRTEMNKHHAQKSSSSSKPNKQGKPNNSHSKINKHEKKAGIFLSNNSLEITGSEFYPAYHGGMIGDHPASNSSLSTSSTNHTVIERANYPAQDRYVSAVDKKLNNGAFDVDAYQPRLYSYGSNEIPPYSAEETPILHRNKQGQVCQNNEEKLSFLDDCHVVGVL